MKALLVSFFNSGNLGDLLLSNELYKIVKRYYATKRYSFSGNPYTISSLDNIPLVTKVNHIDNSMRLRSIIKRIFPRVYILLSTIKQLFAIDFSSYRQDIHDSDLLVIGGGNMVYSTSLVSIELYLFSSYVRYALKSGKKVIVLSIGIGPFYNNIHARRMINVLQKCHYVSFRDEYSLGFYKKYARIENHLIAHRSIDPAFFLSIHERSTCVKLVKVVALNVINSRLIGDSEREYSNLINSYIKLIQSLKNFYNQIVLFSTTDFDYETIYDIYDKIKCSYIYVHDKIGLDSLLDMYNDVNVVIGTRMHALLLAFTQTIPVIGLIWQSKVEHFLDLIDAADYGYSYKHFGTKINSIINATCELEQNNREHREKNRKRIEEIRLLALEDSEVLEKYSITSN